MKALRVFALIAVLAGSAFAGDMPTGGASAAPNETASEPTEPTASETAVILILQTLRLIP